MCNYNLYKMCSEYKAQSSEYKYVGIGVTHIMSSIHTIICFCNVVFFIHEHISHKFLANVNIILCICHISMCYFLQSVILLVLYVDAVVVIVRQTNHFRITRILRPFFLIDTYYMRGVRRLLKHCNFGIQLYSR